jgi:Xaa-Pro dipeptidase
MIFSAAEISRRLDAVRRTLDGADCAVVPSFHNSYYLSGSPMLRWGREQVVLVFRDSEPVVVTPGFEASAIARNSPIRDVRVYWDEEGPSLRRVADLVLEVLRKRRTQRIGLEFEGTSTSLYHVLAQGLPDARFIDVTAQIDDIRSVSSPEEIALSRQACTIGTAGMKAFIDALGEGVLESDAIAAARAAVFEASPAGVSVNSEVFLQQGIDSFEPHLYPVNVPIRAGQIVEIVVEIEVWHYQASPERCVLIGKAPREVERAYEVMLRAFHTARDIVRPGVSFASVDEVSRAIFAEAGYGRMATGAGLLRNITHHTGGRIDSGNFRPYNRNVLKANMIATVEPWALIPGVGGPRHVDQVLVTDVGHEVLTRVEDGTIRK